MTSYSVRMLNDEGLVAFRTYLRGLRTGETTSPPREMLFSPRQSEALSAQIAIEQRAFRSRIDFCEYISDAFGETPYQLIEGNANLWSWLSLFYFDQVCPLRSDGSRRPGMDYRHIPSRDYRYRHRHLLEGAYHVYQMYGMDAALLLCSALHNENSFHHELAGRQGLITNPFIINVATDLYYDIRHNRPKSGAGRGKAPGALLRFVDVINQLDMTFDLFSIQPRRLMELLPAEFDSWKAR
ncbi:MAG TPA: hypothetical protein VLH56_05925 [Dissulfurispiraceae bacterium]|nr:hypothetical protein [Dissulfurispiraceae bacterium]